MIFFDSSSYARPEDVLSRLTQTSLEQSVPLTLSQARIDSSVARALEETTDLSTLMSILSGTFASRFARAGILALGAGASAGVAGGIQVLAVAGSIGAEAVAFEGASRVFQAGGIYGHAPLSSHSSRLWRWEGEGGLRQGLFSSAITFTAFRGAAWLAHGQNVVFQHFIQSGTLVVGHHLAGRLGIVPAPEGSLTEQFFEAERTNLQLSAMMSAFHTALPGIHALERSLDLSLKGPPGFRFEERTRSFFPEAELQPAGWDQFLAMAESSRKRPRRSRGEEAGTGDERSKADLAVETRALRPSPSESPIRVSRVDGKIRVVVGEASVDDVVRFVSENLNRFTEKGNVQVLIPENYPQRIMEWGYRYAEGNRAEWGKRVSEWLRMHEKITQGAGLEAGDLRRLRAQKRKLQNQQDDFERSRISLRAAVNAGVDQNGQATGKQEPFRRVFHDLVYSVEFLTMANMCLDGLIRREPLFPFQVAYLSAPGADFSASGALRDGLARATADVPEMFRTVGDGWYRTSLDELKFLQGRSATKLVGNILANLLTNAWRYGSDGPPKIRLEVEQREEGSVQVTVADEGVGILPEHFLLIGKAGFQEARKEVEGSQGYGLSSVIENLRFLQWGPLWLRSRPGEGTQFRFEIPAFAFRGTKPDRGAGKGPSAPETSLESNLREGFVVPVASLDLAIRQMLRALPGGPPTLATDYGALASGELRYRRTEVLHRLLSGGRNPEGLESIDNGPGSLVHVAVTLARLGGRVKIKEPDAVSGTLHQLIMQETVPASIRERIQYVSLKDLDAESPADIVYWTNPDPYFIRRPLGMGEGEYFGRDVKKGGFLVIQTDFHGGEERLSLPRLDPGLWERIFDEALPNRLGMTNEVLPTAQADDLHLQVYRRR
ncbi:MAG: ATP-binding protein [bacterium]